MSPLRELTAQEWELVETVAFDLAQAQRGYGQSDKGLLTEFKKVLSYYQSLGHGGNLWNYLKIWRTKGDSFGHGGNIEKYYLKIAEILDLHLKPYREDRDLLLQLLGWSSRLAAFYHQSRDERGHDRGNQGQYKSPPESQSPHSHQKPVLAQNIADPKQQLREKLKAQGQDVSVGALLQATVVEKKSSKKKEVVYRVDTIEFIEAEQKRYDKIPDSGLVWVEIKDDELKHVKFKKLAD